MVMVEKEQGFVAVVIAALFGLLFVAASIFGMWAYSGREDFKNNVDAKINAAVELAVEQAETAKEAEFVEKEKKPLRTYTGSATYGSLSFNYPKTWSIYVAETKSGNVIDLYAHPETVHGIAERSPYALRAQITSTTYDQEVTILDSALKTGSLKAQAFRPADVNSVLGLKFTGQINQTTQGAIVLLPLRDRTIKIFTESQEFLNDFNNLILPSIKFIP